MLTPGGGGQTDKGAMVRAARCLLASVTQVLLLADTVVVKQLLQAKDKVIRKVSPSITASSKSL